MVSGESDIVCDEAGSMRSRSRRVSGGLRQDSAVFAQGLEFPILFPLWEAVEEKDGHGERLCYRVEQKAPRG